jgi:hypothetical protein
MTPASGTAPDIRAITGAHATDADNDAAMGRPIAAGTRMALILRAIASPNVTSPPVASAERTNDTSTATSGSSAHIATMLNASARTASDLRSIAIATSCTDSMNAARTADPLAPAKSAYAHASGSPNNAAMRDGGHRTATNRTRTRTARTSATIDSTTSTRCMPDTARRWESPLVRNARSSSGSTSVSPKTSARASGATFFANDASIPSRAALRARSIHAGGARERDVTTTDGAPPDSTTSRRASNGRTSPDSKKRSGGAKFPTTETASPRARATSV